MRMRLQFKPTLIVATFALTLLVAEVLAQNPSQQPLALPPLMYVRIAGPKGMKVTLYRGGPQGQTFDTPAIVGLRPGYVYRVALSDVPNYPNQLFFPTLEVRGSLLLGPRLRNADFPATLNFFDEDFTKAQGDSLLKKVIVLERPDLAIPKATTPEEPIELVVPSPQDPILDAQQRGAPLVVVMMGQRQFAPEELALAATPGTLLLPGEKILGAPRFAPRLHWHCFPVHDPLLGAAHPSELVTLWDGGDIGAPVGATKGGKLRGFDPSDTVAQYTDSKGTPRLAISNRVGLCVPRFVVVKGDISPHLQIAQFGTGSAQTVHGHDTVSARITLAREAKNIQLEKTQQRLKLAGTTNTYGTAITGRVQGVLITTSLSGVQIVDGVCSRPELETPPDRPLVIIKWPEKEGALVGSIVTFYLRYTNQGGRPITNIVVSDSLTTRFEYVQGSAKADREGAFTTQPNDAGSSILRWEFSGTLEPRESGLISFQVRVR